MKGLPGGSPDAALWGFCLLRGKNPSPLGANWAYFEGFLHAGSYWMKVMFRDDYTAHDSQMHLEINRIIYGLVPYLLVQTRAECIS